jgi:gas vesicle protein
LAGVFSVGSAFSTWKEQAQEFGNVARNLHMGIEDVQAWSGAIGKFGGTAGDFEQSIRGLNVQLARMATLGTSKGGKLLESVGIDAGSIGRQRDALEVMEELAAAVEQMTPDESRGFLQALGLDSATIMLLQQGRDGMKDLVRQKKEDAVYTKEDYEAIRQYNVEMGKVKKGFIGIMGIAFRTIMPAFTKVTEYVGKFVKYLKRHQTAVKAFFVMIGVLVTGYLIPTFLAFSRTLMKNPLTWVILALAALALVIEDLIVWLDGGESALEDFWTELFGSPEEAKKTFEDIKKGVKEFVEESIPRLQEFAQEVRDLVQDIRDLWKEISDSTPWKMFQHNMAEVRRDEANRRDELAKMMGDTSFDNFGGAGGGFEANPFGDFIRNFRNEARDSLNGIWDGLKETLSSAWDSVVGTLKEGWQAFVDFGKEILNDIADFAEDTFESIRKFFEDAMKDCEKAASDFASAANNAISGLNSPINALADNIRTNLIGAIDEASARWRAFQQEMAIQASIGGGGGGVTNSTATYNVGSVNFTGATNGREAAADFSNYLTKQSNNGIRW